MSGSSCRDGVWREPPSGRAYGYRLWRPPTVRALLVVLHGFGEHGGRYLSVAQALAGQEICVAVPDLWGHGGSGGARGDLGDVSEEVGRLQRMTEEVFLPASGQQRYALFGHSFGGLTVLVWALRHPDGLTRLIMQSPLLKAGFPIPWWKTAAAGVLMAVHPSGKIPLELDVSALSHDPEVVRAYAADPLVHGVMSARTYWGLIRARDRALRQTSGLRTPVLVLCGEGDRIISVDRVRRWFERVAAEKRLVVFPEAYHELHHEACRDDVVRLVADWSLSG